MSDTALAFGFRIFWALILGGFLAGGFRRAWNIENGKPVWLSDVRDNTVVCLDPILFPMLVLVYMGLYLLILGTKGGIETFIINAVDLFLFISIYFTFLLLILPVLRKYLTARTCATFWLIPVFLYYQPHIIYSAITLPPAVYLYIPQKILMQLSAVWLIGFVIIFVFQIISHIHFTEKLKRHSRPVEDPALLQTWNAVKGKVDYTLPVELRYCTVIHSPLSVGMRKKKKITYLPEQSFTEEEAELIFSHELHHIQRNDTHTKFFLRFCNALGWIHPLVWPAVKKAEDDLELSCDEIVLRDADAKKRKQYALLLLSIAGDSRGFSTCLSASAKTMRYRLKAAMPGKAKKLGTGLLFAIMVLSSLSAGRIALVTARGSAADMTEVDMSEITEADIWVSYIDDDILPITDTDTLSRYLSGIKVEKSITVYEFGDDLNEMRLVGDFKSDNMGFSLTDNYLNIYDRKNVRTETYHLYDPVDWEYIRSLE